MFDKDFGLSCQASISKVAQEAAFYELEIEASLGEMVEKPANPVIDKLLRGVGTIIWTKLRQEHPKHEFRECSSSPDESCAGGCRVLPFGTLSL